jgi:transposase, IS5 family
MRRPSCISVQASVWSVFQTKPPFSHFRLLLEQHELASGTVGFMNGYLGDHGLSLRQGTHVDATLINAPSSTHNKDGKLDPEMHPTKKGNPSYW